MKIIFNDGSAVTLDCNETNLGESEDIDFIAFFKRTYDEDGDYDEDKDEVIAHVNVDAIRLIEYG